MKRVDIKAILRHPGHRQVLLTMMAQAIINVGRDETKVTHMNQIEKYDIQVGQIYRPNDGGLYGHVVVDTTTYAFCDDVVVQAFTNAGVFGEPTRIDAWKLAQVRYYNTGHTVR